MSAVTKLRGPTMAEAEVEQSVLGLLLSGADTAWLVLDRIDINDFREPLHQRIADAARRVLDAGNDPSPLTLAAAMAADPGLDELGGGEYFRVLLSRYGRNRDIAAELCDALADQAQRRALLHEIAETESRLSDNSVPARDILSEHEAAIRALAEGRPHADDPSRLYDTVSAVLERLDTPEEILQPLIPYGAAGLDESIGGMAPGDLVIVGARPGMGKSALALVTADHVASCGKAVLFISLEMRKGQLGERWLSMRAYGRRAEKIPYNLIRLNRIHEHGKGVLSEIASSISQLPLIIDERRGMTVSQIAVRARSIQAKQRRVGVPLGLVIIDHMHLIRPDIQYRNNKAAEVTEISQSLKVLAGQLEVPIMCLCQLNRAVEGRDDKRPQLSDLRESGSIEQDADVVLLLHRPEYYAQKNRPDPKNAEATVKWENALREAKGFINIAAAKVRHGKEDEIKAECEIAYNWIGGRM